MTAEVVLELIEISARLAERAMEIKRQAEISDEQLLVAAEQRNAETRTRAQKFIEQLQAKAAASTPAAGPETSV